MQVLILGGTRFLGYLLAWRLIARGDQVTLLNRGTRADPFGDRVQRLRADRSTEAIEILRNRQFDACVDFAAFDAEDIDRLMSVHNLRIGHYVFISSGQVYLVRANLRAPYCERDYAGPLVPEPGTSRDLEEWRYGVNKRAAEDRIVQGTWPATRLRIPMVNGELDYYRRIESYLWRLLDGAPVWMPGTGARICRHVYGGDVVTALVNLLNRESTFGKAYNLAQPEQVQLQELLTQLAAILGTKADLRELPLTTLEQAGIEAKTISPFSNPWMSLLDPKLAQTELDFATTPLREYLGRIVATFLAHPPVAAPEGYRHRALERRWAGLAD